MEKNKEGRIIIMATVEVMDNSKQQEFFQAPKDRVHIIGCGSVGSTLSDLVARAGFTKIDLYDLDKVEPKNVVNSMLNSTDVGREKTDVVEEMIKKINPAATVMKHGWYNGEKLGGIVLLCPDKIDVRKSFFKANEFNPFVKCVADFRTGLTSGQNFFANWMKEEDKKSLWNSMDFDSSEVQVQVSACGVTLGVAPTVRIICSYGLANLINFLKGKEYERFIEADAFNFYMGD